MPRRRPRHRPRPPRRRRPRPAPPPRPGSASSANNWFELGSAERHDHPRVAFRRQSVGRAAEPRLHPLARRAAHLAALALGHLPRHQVARVARVLQPLGDQVLFGDLHPHSAEPGSLVLGLRWRRRSRRRLARVHRRRRAPAEPVELRVQLRLGSLDMDHRSRAVVGEHQQARLLPVADRRLADPAVRGERDLAHQRHAILAFTVVNRPSSPSSKSQTVPEPQTPAPPPTVYGRCPGRTQGTPALDRPGTPSVAPARNIVAPSRLLLMG